MKLSLPLLSLLVLLSALSGSAQDATGIKTTNLKGADLDLMLNHDPQSELDNFELLPGYEANLFASNPMLANPIHMHWDSKGRLWVACSWSYPQIKPGQVADDKIIILEDTDNDGVADKSTVFADGLYMPTGIELANGGCYVAQTPDVFFLKDTDGDDIADVKQLALTGFGIEDSHHSVSAWRRGPGGWIYFQEGIFLHAQVETQYGVIRNFDGGVYQFNPRTQELRVFCSGTGGNPWGHVFDKWGQSFMVNNPRIMYLSPASGNSGKAMQVKSLISTEKQCGGDLATGSHVGDDIRGQLLTGRFKSRAVVRYEFVENGAGFSANVLKPLISSKHPNFRPVDVKTGPDGAIYVADWYNSIINHAQHDFRDPRRDNEHGRIWRITHKNRPLVKKPVLVGVPIPELVSHLQSPEAWTRHQARKELSERDPEEVVTAIESWTETLSPDLADYDHHLVEAMWAVQNVERVSEPVLNMVLAAKEGRARAAAGRVLRYWHQDLSEPVSLIAKLADDPFPRARMEAVLSAGFIPSAEAYAAALHMLDHESDPSLDQALLQTKIALEPYWRPAFEAGSLTFAHESHKAFVDKEAGIGFAERLIAFLKKDNPGEKESAEIQEQLRTVGTAREVGIVLDALGKNLGRRSAKVDVALLETLETMSSLSQPRSLKRKLGVLKKLLNASSEEVAARAALNIGAWRTRGSDSDLLAVLKDSSRGDALRRAAAIALAKNNRTENLEALRRLSSEGDIKVRYFSLTGLMSVDLDNSIQTAAELLAEDPGSADPVSLIQTILQNRKATNLAVRSFEAGKIHPEVKERVSEFHRASGQLPENLAKVFLPSVEPGGSLSANLLAENEDSLTADVDQKGDPHRGEMIFRRKALACTTCHAIGPAGSEIGPNLVAVGTAATTSYMVESILKPNAAIAEHYENRLFTMIDGSVRMGVVTFKNEEEVVVRDAGQGGKEIRMPVREIAKEKALPSAMPAGLADQLKDRSEFLDLAKFLSVLGKPGEFANDESPVLRKWRIIATPEDQSIPGEDAAWMPAYSKVSGELPPEDLSPGDQVLARSFLTVQAAGAIQLKLNNHEGVSLWIDDEKVEDPFSVIQLETGRHTLTFAIEQRVRGDEAFRVAVEAADNSVKFQPEGGL
ncbi:MAG: hypothetical protein P1U87_17725 [Verrucomicrobiales bacterium]|nr:hypothetical protein [Verrucomicrobiales bacterium]